MDFHDQIFVKDNKTLLKQENVLKRMAKFRPYDKRIAQELFMVQKGLEGEQKVAYQLSKSNLGMYIFHDVKLQFNDLTAQIDYIVFTSKTCYFIEIKNYTGNIKIDEFGNFIREYKYNGKKIKKGMNSPIRQVEAQFEVFTKIALSKEKKIKKLLNGTKFLNYFKSLVVFTDEETILEMDSAPDDIKSRVVRYDGLLRRIEQINSKQENVFSREQLVKFTKFVKSLDKTSDVDYEKYYMNKFSVLNNFQDINIDKLNLIKRRYDISRNIEIYRYNKKISKNNLINNDNNSNTFNKRRIKPDIKLLIGVFFFYLILAFLYFFYDNEVKITDNQQKAISIIKSAYNNSKILGFEIIHTSVCNELKDIFSGQSFSCNRKPLEVNVINDNTISIYKDDWCYTIELNEDGTSFLNTNKERTKCSGYPVGYLEWDDNNEYYQKIGGYTKIREMALYSYINKTTLNYYYDYSHIAERGGNPKFLNTYSLMVDSFFDALTGEGYSVTAPSTNKEQTNKMCEYFYYIMK